MFKTNGKMASLKPRQHIVSIFNVPQSHRSGKKTKKDEELMKCSEKEDGKKKRRTLKWTKKESEQRGKR